MGRITDMVALLGAAAFLGGCTPAVTTTSATVPEQETTAAEAAATTEAELPPGFYLGEEFIEIGEFDPEHVELIDLCAEIPDEVLLEAGMVKDQDSVRKNSDSINCFLEPSDEKFSTNIFLLASDSFTQQSLKESNYIIPTDLQSSTPNSFLYHLGSDKDFSCNASVSTTSGLISLGVQNHFNKEEQKVLCDNALKIFDHLYLELRGK